MAETLYALISLLADGKFHSGEKLGQQLGVGRSAVWKSLQQLPELGLELHAVSGKGYRLASPLELLEQVKIRPHLHEQTVSALSSWQIFNEIDSTSSYLRQQAELGAASGSVCFAEHQTSGRGRRGRHWHSPFGSNLYLSLLWRFDYGMSRLAGISLAMAVALMRSFTEMGATGLGIKWPNDIISEEGKLAGILVDVAGESSGPCYAVIGIGVNYAMPKATAESIDQPWIRLRDCGVAHNRNEVAASLLNHIVNALTHYEHQGFEPFFAEWQQWDMLRDREVTLHMASESATGIARGIDHSGMIRVEQGGLIRHYAAGEVSLRKVTS
jgi:BirA family biotin operon repressor/biotin-[acetyl-CoA-carboxylase] ligase